MKQDQIGIKTSSLLFNYTYAQLIPQKQARQARQAIYRQKKQNQNRKNASDIVESTIQNNIFINQQKNTIFLPGYMRIKLKNIHSINIQDLTGQVNCDIYFTIYYGQLSDQIVQQLKTKLVFLFQNNQPMKIVQRDEGKRNLQIKIVNDENKCQIRYVIRAIFKTKIHSNIFWTPFHVINMILSITVQPIAYEYVENKDKKKDENKVKSQKWTLKVNLMDHLQNYTKFSFNQNIHFAGFKFAPSLSRCFYSNKKLSSPQKFQQFKDAYEYLTKKNKKFLKIQQRVTNNKQKLFKTQAQDDQIQTFNQRLKDNFQYAHFNIPMYKIPWESIVTILMPLILLATINLCVFFQDNDLTDRIGSITALMIAFVALVPTIRQKIPPNPNITILEVMVYFQLFACLLALIHSLNVMENKCFKIQYQSDPLYIISLCFYGIICATILTLLLIYKFEWQPNYETYKYQKTISFKRQEWFNTLFYLNFKGFIQSRKKHYTEYKQLINKQKITMKYINEQILKILQ